MIQVHPIYIKLIQAHPIYIKLIQAHPIYTVLKYLYIYAKFHFASRYKD